MSHRYCFLAIFALTIGCGDGTIATGTQGSVPANAANAAVSASGTTGSETVAGTGAATTTTGGGSGFGTTPTATGGIGSGSTTTMTGGGTVAGSATTTTGGGTTGSTAGGATGSGTTTGAVCTTDTWDNFEQQWFGTYCANCHGFASSYSGVQNSASDSGSRISSGNMPPNGGLSSADIARVTQWIKCGLPLQ